MMAESESKRNSQLQYVKHANSHTQYDTMAAAAAASNNHMATSTFNNTSSAASGGYTPQQRCNNSASDAAEHAHFSPNKAQHPNRDVYTLMPLFASPFMASMQNSCADSSASADPCNTYTIQTNTPRMPMGFLVEEGRAAADKWYSDSTGQIITREMNSGGNGITAKQHTKDLQPSVCEHHQSAFNRPVQRPGSRQKQSGHNPPADSSLLSRGLMAPIRAYLDAPLAGKKVGVRGMMAFEVCESESESMRNVRSRNVDAFAHIDQKSAVSRSDRTCTGTFRGEQSASGAASNSKSNNKAKRNLNNFIAIDAEMDRNTCAGSNNMCHTGTMNLVRHNLDKSASAWRSVPNLMNDSDTDYSMENLTSAEADRFPGKMVKIDAKKRGCESADDVDGSKFKKTKMGDRKPESGCVGIDGKNRKSYGKKRQGQGINGKNDRPSRAADLYWIQSQDGGFKDLLR
jgi:hypothetical protein